MLNPFEKIRTPQKREDIIKKILNQLPRIQGTSQKDREIRRLVLMTEELEKYIAFLNSLQEAVHSLHPFYLTLIEIESKKDKEEIKRCIFKTKKVVLQAQKIVISYIYKIKRCKEPKEANKYMREAFGRFASILRRKGSCIDELIDIVSKVKKAEAIDPSLPTIIIAGSPNVGKSTLVGKISTAKPEVAYYPFTTKEVHVGHIVDSLIGPIVQVIDTPGILDRPLEERNEIEKKAINAVMNLQGIIVYLFDVSKSAMYTVDEQINIMNEIREMGKTVIPVINKIDDKNESLYNDLKSRLENLGVRYFEISAEKGINVDRLLSYIFELFNITKSRGD